MYVGRYGNNDMDALLHSMQGLSALTTALLELGVTTEQLCEGTGITPDALDHNETRLSNAQKIALFANVARLTPEPAIGLRAGQRQRISDFGVWGYAIVTSATFGEAVAFGMQHVRLAGPVLEKSFRIQGDVAIFEGHDVVALGALLPLVTEFWFSSIHALISRILERPFEAQRLLLPYPAPPHAAEYEAVLRCPVMFDAPVMQWEFDASLLGMRLPNANPVMADVCTSFCSRMLEAIRGEHPLVRSIKEVCLNSVGDLPRAEAMAAQLNLSPRTLHRRLSEAGTSYQDILDGIRKRVAIEFLERTGLSVDEIAERSGFSDVSNFRKAFKKWTGQTPAYYRDRRT